MKPLKLLAVVPLAIAFLAGVSQAQSTGRPPPAPRGAWVQLGGTQASHTADHDTIYIRGNHDEFRRIKFVVRDAPLNMERVVVTYDNGGVDRLPVRENIRQGGESRAIDLRGTGRRSLSRIDFWYDTKGWLRGTANVNVWGQK